MSIITTKEEKTIINAGKILDIRTGNMLANKSIIIENGYIKNIIKRKNIKYRNQKEKVINLTNSTLIPGFVESHVHFALNGISLEDSAKDWDSPGLMQENIKRKLNEYLKQGIFAIRDGGDQAGIGIMTRDISEKNNVLSPIVQIPGKVIRRKGFYGSFLGQGIKDLTEIDAVIEELAKSRVNHIKVLVSGIVSFSHFGKVGPVQFTLFEMKKIVELAHSFNLKVMAHASSDEAVKIAVQAGVDSIEHGYFLSDSVLELMKDKKTFWVPTVVPVYNQTSSPWRENFDNKQLSVIKDTYNHHLRILKKADTLGVNIAVGTDAGAAATPHIQSFFTEMLLYKKAGLSNLHILQAATLNGARLLGLDDKIGVIEKGKLPCFIALADNPLENLDVLKNIEKIIIPEQFYSNNDSLFECRGL